jgi:hypothetical protein
MTHYIPTIDSFQSSSIIPIGFSETARELYEIDFKKSFTSSEKDLIKRQLIKNLIDAINSAPLENWDGYDANSIDPGSVLYAIHFINLLPTDLPEPVIAVDNDGEVAFEWDYGPRKIISIRVSRDGTIFYAGLVGLASFHGVEILQAYIPKAILASINRVIQK